MVKTTPDERRVQFKTSKRRYYEARSEDQHEADNAKQLEYARAHTDGKNAARL